MPYCTSVLILLLDKQLLGLDEIIHKVRDPRLSFGVQLALIPYFLVGLLIKGGGVELADDDIELVVIQVVFFCQILGLEGIFKRGNSQLAHLCLYLLYFNDQIIIIHQPFQKEQRGKSLNQVFRQPFWRFHFSQDHYNVFLTLQELAFLPITLKFLFSLTSFLTDSWKAPHIFFPIQVSIQYFNRKKQVHKMQSLLQSINKPHLQSSASSQDNNRSTVKRLFSSVFSIIDNDSEITDFSEEPHQSRIEKLLDNCVFVTHLQNKLRNQGLCDGYNLPIIRISVAFNTAYPHCAPFLQKAELDSQDIARTFQKFGEINKIILTAEKKDAYIFFNSFINAYIAFKMLRSVKIRGGSLEIMMDWVHNNDIHHEISNEVHIFINNLNWENLFENKRNKVDGNYFQNEETNNPNSKQNKFTCRYEIQIENEREFQVARRIIGSKGCNMKKILEESIMLNNQNKNYSNDNANQLLKLRLRGKGSGYKEGPEQQESNESLHLCVSAKDEVIYSSACSKVERLLTSIYSDYVDFTRKQGKSVDLTVKKINIGQSGSNEEPLLPTQNYQNTQVESYDTQQNYANMMYRIAPQKISELLELRNKARRELNFNEADRIRNYLRSCGVCLIDEKGRRGKATEVTTWKYLY